ncbi:MAG: glycosyltransferase family 39 protein [Flavihumibacter sp.]
MGTIFPALFGALTIVVVWKAVRLLGGRWMALLLAATCLLLSSLLRLNLLFQPNSPDVLCWTTLYFFVICYCRQPATKFLYAAAVCFAAGFLNKYNIVFAVAGLLPALLLTPHRKLFAQKALYGSMALALVLIMPNLLWQYHQGFPVVHHMKLLADTQLVDI